MFDRLPRPLLFAHRGASLHAPENTLGAFEQALEAGAHVLELDVHLSRDGVVVVHHDRTLERTTSGTGPIRASSWKQLQDLDAGYGFRMGESFPFRGLDHRIPSLAEVLNAFPGTALNIELKQHEPPMVEAVLRCLRGVAAERILLAAGEDRTMRQLEAADPPFPLGMARGHIQRAVLGAYCAGVPRRFRGRALQIPPYSDRGLPVASRRLIYAAHAAGLEVHIWTLNDPVEAHRWLRRGADGIMTDDPLRLAPLFTPRPVAA